MKNIYNQEYKVKVNSPDFKKMGYKITLCKPQGKQDEQYIRDKFRSDFWQMFIKPNKNLVAKGGGINGDGGSALDNIGSGEDMEEVVYNEMGVELYLSELTPQQRKIAELRLKGYSYKEIGDELGISDRTVQEHIQEIRKNK